jgi:hypothetical protein
MRANLPSYVQNKIIEVCCKIWFHIVSHKISLRIHDHLIRTIDHYVMIRKLQNHTFYMQWELNSLYWRSDWTHRNFCLPKVWYTLKDDLDRVHWPWFNLSSHCTYVICIIPVQFTTLFFQNQLSFLSIRLVRIQYNNTVLQMVTCLFHITFFISSSLNKRIWIPVTFLL